ncbi:MAG: dihydroorotase, partial [Actinomycetes bacterium]
MSDSDFLLKNILTSDGTPVEIEVRDHRITRVGSEIDSDLTTIDGRGAMVLPGLVDLHTHLREPGKENSETVLSGSQ